MSLMRIAAGVLEVAYEESGPAGGTPVLLLHGFPYDIHAFDEVAQILAQKDCRAIVPYVRGYGPTRFRSAATPRSGQQAAIAHDAVALMDALGIGRAILAGYDWGGRGACIVSAVWPQRVIGLVSAAGYAIQDIAGAAEPAAPEQEFNYWYQYYFHGERGRKGLVRNRRGIAKLLWRLWSPNWRFDDATFERTAASFDNPDFVEVVLHSYRHRYGLVPGDPAYEATEVLLAKLPPIGVPTVVLHGAENGVHPVAGSARHERHFTARYERRVIPVAGHNVPQEVPAEFAEAVLSLR
jgi:pimeloyl-ACP methyl ester carboxylesterase